MAAVQDYREPGVCRCCLSEGTYKSMELQYVWAGKQENYTDMLRDAFDMTLMRVNMATLICSVCVMRLRDACAFRRQVHDSERTFFQRSFGPAGVQIKIEEEEGSCGIEEAPAVEEGSCGIEEAPAVEEGSCGIEDAPAVSSDNDDLAPSDLEEDVPLNTIPPARRPAAPPPAPPPAPAVLAETGGRLDNGKQHVQSLVESAELHTKIKKPKAKRALKECEVCKKTFRYAPAMRQHMCESHQIDQIFTCGECDAPFSTNRERFKHMKVVHGYSPNARCPKCPEIIKTHSGKMKHLEKVHGVVWPKFPCGACDKVYKTKHGHLEHQRSVHLQERQRDISCLQCDAKFFSQRGLKDHMVRHGEVERTHECEYCKKTFLRRKTLIYHKRIHTGDKRKVCRLCGLAFVQRASLKYHMTRYHPGDADV